MSIFLVKTLEIRGGWGLCLQTPLVSGGWKLRPPHSRFPPPLPNPVCATGQAYKVLLPPPRYFGLAAPLMTPFRIVAD